MSEKRFSYNDLLEVEMIFDEKNDRGYYVNGENCASDDVKELVDLLNEQDRKIRQLNSDYNYLKEVNKETVKQCERWKNLYELKDSEVSARVDALNTVCEYYTSEVLFKSDVDPNKAVREVINRILNTEVEMW